MHGQHRMFGPHDALAPLRAAHVRFIARAVPCIRAMQTQCRRDCKSLSSLAIRSVWLSSIFEETPISLGRVGYILVVATGMSVSDLEFSSGGSFGSASGGSVGSGSVV